MAKPFVTLDGKDHYLVKHDTRESREQYGRRIAEWPAAGRIAAAVAAAAEAARGSLLQGPGSPGRHD